MKYKPGHIRKTDPVDFPCKKKMYNSLNEAQEAIDYLQKIKYVKDLSAYKCSVCGFWHLTSK